MTGFLIFIFFSICILILKASLGRPDGIYHFTFLSMATFLGFVGIQLLGLSNNLNVPDGMLDRTVILAIMCVLMIYFGWEVGSKPYKKFNYTYSSDRLKQSSLMLSLVGAVFYFLISRLPEEIRTASQPTGIVVALRFFAQAMTYGFALALILYFTQKSKFALAIIFFDILFYLDRILIAARRGEAALVLIIFFLSLWFAKKWLLPKYLVIIGILFSTLFIYSTGDYRNIKSENYENISIFDIKFQENLSNIINNGGSELELATYQIEAISSISEYDMGAFYWNSVIFNFFPAQIFGNELKNKLTIQSEDAALKEFGYVGMTGSTSTGLVDVFKSFWYFGVLIFFIISYFLARVYSAALKGNVAMQLVYMIMLVNGLHSITHNAGWFISPFIHMLIFLAPALLYSRIK